MSKKVLAAIEAVGGKFEEYGSRTELMGWASLPEGKTWNATGCHTIAIHFYSDRPAGWKALYKDVQQGVGPCDLDDCNICNGL